MVQSMSRKGDCWDNAVAERFFRTLKSEQTNGRIYETREDLRKSIFDFIEVFYNRERLHSTLGYMSPEAFESICCRSKQVSGFTEPLKGKSVCCMRHSG